jgi:tryptophan-rich sensory protein
MKLNYLLIPLFIFATGAVGSLITDQGMEWYKTINLPNWTPQGAVIGSVWTILFILAIISFLIFWNKSNDNKKRDLALVFFALSGVLNTLWSFLFFGQHYILAAVFESALLAISVITLIFLMKPVSKISSLLFLPYFLWVCFATYLTFAVWQLN